MLIIGILATVALPQYKQAILKSRMGTLMTNVKTIINALEVYYLANGEYPSDSDANTLDIDIGGCILFAGTFSCKTQAYDYNGNGSHVVGGFLYNQLGLGYVQYPIHDSNTKKQGNRECWADSNNPTANNVCKSLGGMYSGTSNWRTATVYNHTTGTWITYKLP